MVALVLIHRGACNPTATHTLDCNTADIVVKAGQSSLITKTDIERNYTSLSLYVKTKPDFEGFILTVDEDEGRQLSAWFPATHACVPQGDKWHRFLLFARVDKNKSIILGYYVGNCMEKCTKYISVQSVQSVKGLSVLASGASQWSLHKPPSHCDVINVDLSQSTRSPLVCHDPPASTTPVWSWLVPILVLLGIMAVLYWFYRNRNNQQNPPPRNSSLSSRPF